MRAVSVLGDSISTYEGYNPQGYAVFYDRDMQLSNELNKEKADEVWAKGVIGGICLAQEQYRRISR